MPLTSSRPLTPGQRFLTRNKQEVSDKKPERRLTKHKHIKKIELIDKEKGPQQLWPHHITSSWWWSQAQLSSNRLPSCED